MSLVYTLYLVIFGGLYWIVRICIEKYKDDKAERERQIDLNDWRTRKEAWMNRVTDRCLEMELEDFIYRSSNHAEVREIVMKALREIPQRTIPDYYCLSPEEVQEHYGRGAFTKKERENIATNRMLEALRIMMAQKGKLTYNDAEFGISNNGSFAPTKQQMREWNNDFTRFAEWINAQLKKHGIDEPMFIKTPSSVFTIDSCRFRNGAYVWAPMISKNTAIRTDDADD